MECRVLRRKLSAYIDQELSVEERRLVERHLGECAGCAQELQVLKEQAAYLQKAEQPAVPADFKVRFWQKVRTLEEKGAASKSIWDGVFKRFVPVPVAAAFAVVVFSVFTLFSPVVYGVAAGDVRRDMSALAEKAFAGYAGKQVFGPAAFAEFCDGCRDMLCKCSGSCGSDNCNCAR
jgi:anti-sigma factor RsiW